MSKHDGNYRFSVTLLGALLSTRQVAYTLSLILSLGLAVLAAPVSAHTTPGSIKITIVQTIDQKEPPFTQGQISAEPASVGPNCTVDTINWVSSDTDIAAIVGSATELTVTVKGNKAGTATMTVTVDGKCTRRDGTVVPIHHEDTTTVTFELLKQINTTGTDDPPCCTLYCPKHQGKSYDAYTGNAHRAIKDLEIWGGVGQHALTWTRYANSRAADDVNLPPPLLFGEAHHWRHGYQWEMVETAAGELVVHYPEGGYNTFTTTGAGEWVPTTVVGKRIFQDGNNFVLQREDGYRYRFEKQTDADGSIHYQMEDFTDTAGDLYDLIYDPADRTLTKVTEPAGRFLTIAYKTEDGLKVIDQVSTSDGRSASYGYTLFADGVSTWVELTSVGYGDGTVATYEYHQSAAGTAPLLAHAVDPRLLGSSVDMIYEYDETPGTPEGFVLRERNGKTGETLSTLTVSDTEHLVAYANGAARALTFPTGQQGQVSSYKDGLGRVTEYTYDAGGVGFLLEQKDAEGRVTKYTRTIYGNPLSMTYAAGTGDEATESWTRDDLDLVLTHTDERGFVMTYTRDALHRVTRIDYPDGAFEEFTYNAFGQVLTHRRRNGGLEQLVYDQRGLMTSFKDAAGFVTSYGYDSADRLASVTDARGNKSEYEYNERGLLTKITNADESVRSYAYDDFGNRTSLSDELTHTWSSAYDEFRRLTSRTDPLVRTMTYTYDLPGVCGCAHEEDKPTEITLPSGKITAIEYDTEWQKIAETVGDGSADAARTQYAYDKVGNLLIMTDPRGTTTDDPHDFEWTTAYDQRDRKKSASDPLGHTTAWTYDDAGNVLTAIRPDGGVTTYDDINNPDDDYDPMNRLTQMTDPENQTTQYEYDKEGNLVKLTDANEHIYSFEYGDLRNLRTKLGYPDGTAEQFAYDAVGNLATYTTRKGQVRTYTYDERDRETLADWDIATTPDVTTAYDDASRVTERKSRVSTLTYLYDEANQLLSETQKVKGAAGGAKTIAYDYNADALAETLTYPDSTTLTYGYSGRNQLASIAAAGASALVEYSYDLNGNRLTKALENGTNAAYAHDAANRMTSVEHLKAATAFASFGYGYDEVNRRTFVNREDGRGDEFGYDAVDQLKDVLYQVENPDADPNTPPLNPARTVHYEYHATADGRVDKVGNRLEVVDNGITASYEPNELNQYTQVADLPLDYSVNGNLRTHNGWTYTYDAQNRLIGAKNATTTVTFKYDPRNRQVQRKINGVKTFFYYDGWNLVDERNSAGVQLAEYVHGGVVDELLSRTTASGAVYYHQDSIGSVTQLTDGAGEVVEKYEYDVFGAPTVLSADGSTLGGSAVGNRFLFTGREFIAETGLYDYRNRVYSGELGRFLQTDPIRFGAGDVNLYRYCGNNVINCSDPVGYDNFVPSGVENTQQNIVSNVSAPAPAPAPAPNPATFVPVAMALVTQNELVGHTMLALQDNSGAVLYIDPRASEIVPAWIDMNLPAVGTGLTQAQVNSAYSGSTWLAPTWTPLTTAEGLLAQRYLAKAFNGGVSLGVFNIASNNCGDLAWRMFKSIISK